MWSMTQDGFVSVVNKQGGLQVRSRDLESIQRFCDLARVDRKRIVEGGGTDYQYRVRRVSKKDVKRYLCATVDGIDYSNFKNQAKVSRDKQYADALGGVWSVMWRIAPKKARDAWWGPVGASTTTPSVVPPVTPALTLDEFEKMSGKDRDHAIWALEDAEAMGDEHAITLLAEIDGLLAEERADVLDESKSIHEMTDEEYAEYERTR